MSLVASPVKLGTSPSKFAMMRQQSSDRIRTRHPLEDHDPNSQDSGYGANSAECIDAKTGFRFVEPFALAPRRPHSDTSPMKENANTSPLRKPASKLFHSLSSGSGSESLDDSFLELLDEEEAAATGGGLLPCGLNSLLSKPILREENQATTAEEWRPKTAFRAQRSMSLVENITPNSSRARSCLFRPTTISGSPMLFTSSDEASRPFKRPEPPCDYVSPSQSKRRKSSSLHSICENADVQRTVELTKKVGASKFKRCFSETEATIMSALHRSSLEPDLIGDFTAPYILPLMDGRHQDLKSISPDTLAELMDGQYSDTVETFTVVDCRYPYEFEGGHIRGARNIFTKDQVLKDFVDGKATDVRTENQTAAKRKHIVVFHCEFSSERGPNLYRFLRNCDREQNKECYPALLYPELYLLDGGYKNFYERHSAMCEPQAYRPMLHPNHETDLKHFRAKSKSWNGDSKSRLALRSNLKRLGI